MISIALFEPQIPPNTGNIARLAVGLNIPLILVGQPAFSLSDKYLKRAGLDYWDHLDFTHYPDMESFLERTASRRKILATTKGAAPYYQFQYKEGDILLFGSETGGLPMDFLKKNLATTVTIPMPGKVRSLNLSNSVSIIAYRALEQLDYFSGFTVNSNYYTEL